MKQIFGGLLLKDLDSELKAGGHITAREDPKYREWIHANLVGMVNEFFQKNNVVESYFVKGMNSAFKTGRFELLVKKWTAEYLFGLFVILDNVEKLTLDNNPLNKFGVEKYYLKSMARPDIKWKPQPGLSRKILSILMRCPVIIYRSLNKGLKVCGKRKKYKVMREANWGLYGTGGYYLHDDFVVDNIKITKDDLLLFSRGIHTEGYRLKGYNDAKLSPYAHFDLFSLSLAIGPFFLRIIPKYIISGSKALFKEISSGYFMLYWSIYLFFIDNALPYEKLFSHFTVVSELGHNVFYAGHIAEAIVCQNYGAKYYMTHYSDNSTPASKVVLPFLGCDRFLLWGRAFARGIEADPRIFISTGYIFKDFVKRIAADRNRALSEMGINPRGKIISFFDESFGGEILMTERHYVTFWETALMLAEKEKDSTVLIKPKVLHRYHNLSGGMREKFLDIRDRMEKMPNVRIIDWYRWSFIEVIGVSDIVVTQGMTSSATIAIICGIQGLYLDQAHYDHAFSGLFKDMIVFDDPEKLLSMVQKIINGSENPLKNIPEDILREYDAFPDNRGIGLFRDILSGEAKV